MSSTAYGVHVPCHAGQSYQDRRSGFLVGGFWLGGLISIVKKKDCLEEVSQYNELYNKGLEISGVLYS